MPPVATPYARETRFKGRKRVSVGIRPSNRTKSTEKRETENKPIANENQPVQVKEEEQDMDMFCISALAERNAGPDSEDTDTVCAFCYLDCHTSTDLKKHLRVHTGEKPHECDLCELAFARASHLARHRRVHTGERPFTCSGCGRTFSRQDKLKQHARRHHAAEPVKGPTMRAMRIDKPRRPRGRPPKLNRGTAWAKQLLEESTTGGLNKILAMQRNSAIDRRNVPDLTPDSSNTTLPFGDTSYLSSLSLGQQRYNDLTISPIIDPGPSSSRSVGSSQKMAEDLLQSVRQLGECTIQAFPGQAPLRTRVE